MIFWKHILAKLQAQQKVYLLTVVANAGSSPGRRGFKMLVAEDGFIFGSIGGGVMEYNLVAEAQRLLASADQPTFIKKQIHRGSIKDGSGMICSGEQSVVFHCLSSEDIPTIETILSALANGKQGILSLAPKAISFSPKLIQDQFNFSYASDVDWSYNEQLGYRASLYIVGGGHVGVAVSELLNNLEFHVHVLDNRSQLNTFTGNQFAHQKTLVNYENIAEYIPSAPNSYVAIMTNKYTEDKLVLSKLINNNYKFIGVLGSKAKLKTMWKDLLKAGVARETLDKVHAPIGLAIKSQTPTEIAVSIAAQIIQVKNAQLG